MTSSDQKERIEKARGNGSRNVENAHADQTGQAHSSVLREREREREYERERDRKRERERKRAMREGVSVSKREREFLKMLKSCCSIFPLIPTFWHLRLRKEERERERSTDRQAVIACLSERVVDRTRESEC